MKISDFDYTLPQELIAQYPADVRSQSRMLVLNRERQTIEDRHFCDLPEILDESYFLVVNDSRVFKARLYGKKQTGAQVEVFLVRRQKGLEWVALLRPSARIKKGDRVYFDEELYVTAIDNPGEAERVIAFASEKAEGQVIGKYGKLPLPPYIKRDAGESDDDRYQTVYAAQLGSVAAPTAGLHFDDDVLRRLDGRGIAIEKLTLHVGPGTFKPVTVENIEDHSVDPEFASLSDKTAATINDRKKAGQKLAAVGTTSIRTLEAFAHDDGLLVPNEKMVDLFIYPPYRYKAVEAIITNFHLPRTSLLMLVAAFCGREFLLSAYEHAVEQNYRFYSYGDCMLIL
ncbi:MAG: tRNA preQ1(34) S-adenosylmethionine ribosyltransferase-isomerase QueA [Candidatus Zixiibacteriota bacterium]